MSASTNLESVLELLDDLAVTSLSDWQASKAYATLTGKKTMHTQKDFTPLVQNVLSLVYAGKLARPVLAFAKKDVYMISQSSDDVLKSLGTAQHSFVWEERCVATPSIVKRVLDEASQSADPAKRRNILKDLPFYNEIGRTQVYNAPFCHEQDAEKASARGHLLCCN